MIFEVIIVKHRTHHSLERFVDHALEQMNISMVGRVDAIHEGRQLQKILVVTRPLHRTL